MPHSLVLWFTMFTRWFSRRSILVFIRNYLLEGLFNHNNDDDLKVAHPQSGSSSTRFLIKLEFGNVGFWGEGKSGVPGEKTSRSKGENQQQTQPTFGVDARIWTQATLVGEASALTTVPSLAPHHHPVKSNIFIHQCWPFLHTLTCWSVFFSLGTSNILIMSGMIIIIMSGHFAGWSQWGVSFEAIWNC